jgi:DsbC/DsbD-like thiol-disulfide interchange protein
MIGFERLRRSAAASGIILVSLAGSVQGAEDASAWVGDSRSAVRLIAGSFPEETSAPLQVGIEIRLEPRWHTYWRYPGDAGVPPRFDFSGSHNLKAATVLWPAPRRIPEQGLSVIGYTGNVILPVLLVPQDRAQPITLHLEIAYAVCEKLCVPEEAMLELPLVNTHSSYASVLAAALSRVPKRRALGEGTKLVIQSIRKEASSSRSRVIIDVLAPAGADVDLIAEGPSPDWAPPLPHDAGAMATGLRRFAFDLDGAPPGISYDGAVITITAVAAEEAIEVSAPLD